MWLSPEPLAQLQVLQNSGSRMFMLRVKTLSVRDRQWQDPRKRECSNIKASVSVHWQAQCQQNGQGQQRVSESYWDQTHVGRLTTTRLNDWAIGSYQFLEENSIWLVTTSNFQSMFCLQDCWSRIAQVKYQARHDIPEFLNANRWLIHHISLDMDWSWNILTCHNFCSMLIEQLSENRGLEF